MAQDESEQEVRQFAEHVRTQLVWLASERRSWDEIGDAWRANPAAAVFEPVARFSARGYARSLAMCVGDLNDGERPLLRSLLEQAVQGAVPGVSEADARADQEALEALARRARSLSDAVVAFDGPGRIATHDVFGDFAACLDETLALGNRYLLALEQEVVERPPRRFYPNGMMRRAWLAADWRPSLFPARADIERAGEFWPILDFISERDHGAIVLAMDNIIDRLRDRALWTRDSPIRSVLDELGLPATDACVQLVKDQLFARGMDWRPSPPPIPPQID